MKLPVATPRADASAFGRCSRHQRSACSSVHGSPTLHSAKRRRRATS